MKKLFRTLITPTGLAVVAVLLAGIALAASAGNIAVDYGDRWVQGGLILGTPYAAGNKLTKVLGGPAAGTVIDFASSTTPIDSSAITVTGAKGGDACAVGPPAAAGVLNADFSCYVSAADTVKVKFTPSDTKATTCTLNAGSPSVCTATVSAGSICTCTLVGTTAATAAQGVACNLVSTTLTATSANAGAGVVNIYCAAPVDPASGNYWVRTFSSQ